MIRKYVVYPTAAMIKLTDFLALRVSSIEIAATARTANKTAKNLNGFLMGKLRLVAKSGRPLLLQH
jgi:hypothetical protein